jgi:flavin-dependent dehydrogenase
MTDEAYDVLAIGGGPAGATLAARLAQLGRRVAVLEQDRFPRFHIGESLLPCTIPLLDQVGALHKVEAAGFLRKHAAEFVTADGLMTRRYPFAEGIVAGPAYAYEVDRASFDTLLLEHAEASGATVKQGVKVVGFDIDGRTGARVMVRDQSGNERRLYAEMVADCTGQRALLSTHFGLKRMDPDLKNFAIFSHYQGALRGSGDREGDISIVLVPEGWWWVIPLSDDRTSVGLVAPKRALAGRKADESYFADKIAATPYLRRRLQGAVRTAPVRTTSDYSFVSRQVAGDRWLLVGDAAAFIDPVFSTGVHLGIQGALRAADAIHRALSVRRYERSRFAAYERWLMRSVGAYSRFVKGFYTPEFAEVMMNPTDTLELRQAVTSLLSGRGSDCFEVNWRILIFKTITRLNKYVGLTPRLSDRRQAFERLKVSGLTE